MTQKIVKTVRNKMADESKKREQPGASQNGSTGTLNDAIAIAAIVHKDQTDKAGDPYILHPLRLMMKMNTEEARITAVLHDVVEDSRDNPAETRWTFERLRADGFSEEIVEAVEGVTNRKEQGETYEEFVERAAANPISRAVKIADLEDNMNMLRMRELIPKDLKRLEKYHRAWLRLTASIES